MLKIAKDELCIWVTDIDMSVTMLFVKIKKPKNEQNMQNIRQGIN